VSAVITPPRPLSKEEKEGGIQDLSTGSGGYTSTTQELRRIVPEADGRVLVRPRWVQRRARKKRPKISVAALAHPRRLAPRAAAVRRLHGH
jgi:hypothetical protein